MQLDLRTLGQFARNFKQGMRGNRRAARGFNVGIKCLDNLQVKIGCGQLDRAVFARLNQYVR